MVEFKRLVSVRLDLVRNIFSEVKATTTTVVIVGMRSIKNTKKKFIARATGSLVTTLWLASASPNMAQAALSPATSIQTQVDNVEISYYENSIKLADTVSAGSQITESDIREEMRSPLKTSAQVLAEQGLSQPQIQKVLKVTT